MDSYGFVGSSGRVEQNEHFGSLHFGVLQPQSGHHQESQRSKYCWLLCLPGQFSIVMLLDKIIR